jgi:dTDP-4-dehydrorhamnose reductase
VQRFDPHSPALAAFEPRLPLLVAGIQGVPGYNAFLYFSRLFPGQVHGLVPLHSELPAAPLGESLASSGLIRIDQENQTQVAQLFSTYPYRSVIDASGWCALKAAELDPALARRMNIDMGVNVLREAVKAGGVRFVRLSSDLVFSGTPRRNHAGEEILGGYSESDPVDPVTMYGKCMAEAERIFLSEAPETFVLRVSLPMGPSPNGHAGAVDWIDSRFRRRLPATLYYDEVRTPIYVQDLNAILMHLLGMPSGPDLGGLVHVGGPRRLSLNQIAQIVNVAGNYAPELLHGCLRQAAGPMPPRAGDVTMVFHRLDRLCGAGVAEAWPWLPQWDPIDRGWHSRRAEPVPAGSIDQHLYGKGWEWGVETLPWDHPTALLEFWKSRMSP